MGTKSRRANTDLYVELRYALSPEKVEVVHTNMNNAGIQELLENFVLDQVGKGKDTRKANSLMEYRIKLGILLEDDTIFEKDDCGNKGLRDGIIMRCMALLPKE